MGETGRAGPLSPFCKGTAQPQCQESPRLAWGQEWGDPVSARFPRGLSWLSRSSTPDTGPLRWLTLVSEKVTTLERCTQSRQCHCPCARDPSSNLTRPCHALPGPQHPSGCPGTRCCPCPWAFPSDPPSALCRGTEWGGGPAAHDDDKDDVVAGAGVRAVGHQGPRASQEEPPSLGSVPSCHRVPPQGVPLSRPPTLFPLPVPGTPTSTGHEHWGVHSLPPQASRDPGSPRGRTWGPHLLVRRVTPGCCGTERKMLKGPRPCPSSHQPGPWTAPPKSPRLAV